MTSYKGLQYLSQLELFYIRLMENCDFAAHQNPANYCPIRKLCEFYASLQVPQAFNCVNFAKLS